MRSKLRDSDKDGAVRPTQVNSTRRGGSAKVTAVWPVRMCAATKVMSEVSK